MNALARATSPYLRQHAHDPVDWREWNEDSLALARARDRPILLSIGYAACHWCHVMAKESFSDPEIAALMNRHFVNIKVDREERPDLDAIYQHALALLGEQGGWPLTMFLTPDGIPFWGGTYFPPEPRWGRPSFRQVLERIAQVWREERGTVEASRTALARALGELARSRPGPEIDVAFALEAARTLGDELDPVHGGFSGAPKFPQAPAMAFLWQASLLIRNERLSHRLAHSLARMCQGGIFDHIGGGFARYSVDAFWLVPHFEKMLYDNAQILELLGEVWAATANPLFAVRARETVEWLEREMRVDGAFAASLDADSEGEEGRYYLWTRDELRALLGADAERFELAYGVTRAGNFEGRNILNRLHEPGLADPETEAFLARCRAILREARGRRTPPARDDKVLADWNGLAIAALARCGFRFEEPRWIELAREAFSAVVALLGSGDRLVHGACGGRRLDRAFLDDYAQMIRAALALFEVTGDESYLERALAWTSRAEADFFDADRGWALAPERPDLPVRPRSAHDGPTPSAVGTIAAESVRLWSLTGEAVHHERARRTIAAVAADIRRNPFAHATLLGAALLAHRPVRVLLAGREDDARYRELRRAVARVAVPNRVLLCLPGPRPEGTARFAPGLGADQPVVEICLGLSCLAPARTPVDLAARLAEVASAPL
ncbi:MAG: thioredoxin domain-containing protein [Geminicoccaceae bacterium]|nr:thioredoxin domain-containing protein [Geminicoccaceae bacterium]